MAAKITAAEERLGKTFPGRFAPWVCKSAGSVTMFGRLKTWWKQRRMPAIAKARPPKNIDEFAELLARSGIATSQQANKWLAQFRAEHPVASDPPTAIAEFCSYLIANEDVTEWQCEKLKLGRWKGFYFEDHYLLVEQVGKGGSEPSSYYSSYKACDKRTNNLVCLFIRPLLYTGGHIEYRVYPYM
jgi:hypothetical protein